MIKSNFTQRHNGIRAEQIKDMLAAIGTDSMESLINETIPASIRLKEDIKLDKGISEYAFSQKIREIANKNKVFNSYIGLGYYDTILPAVIQKNILENPGWYTSYTPYQAEISQGRLEALLNFQTVITELTGFELANSSLLDEATAGAEAMLLAFHSRSRKQVKANVNVFYVDSNVFPQTIDVLKTRSTPLGIDLKIVDFNEFEYNDKVFGYMVQYPNQYGNIESYKTVVEKAHENEAVVCVASDLMSLALLTPPAEWGADVVFGNSQRFGVPMGFGGPHAAFFASSEKYKRSIPGRIIGISVDAQGNRALRMALQTREQHIKREKATSNICTAQALLAIMSGMYAVYHGNNGIKEIAKDINDMAAFTAIELEKLGYKQLNKNFFDTLLIETPANVSIEDIKSEALSNRINLRYIDENHIGISIGETKTIEDLNILLGIFAKVNSKEYIQKESYTTDVKTISEEFTRTSDFLTQAVFNTYHSETEMMRYIKRLEIKDLSLNRAMIPLGSCTMKLNAATEMIPISWPEFGNIHPFVPMDQVEGFMEMINDLKHDLAVITGFDEISLQPNSGAAGEYSGLSVIMAYHKSRGEGHRNICLIPSSAHGTNPASAVMAGMKVVVVKSTELGEVDLDDLKAKVEEHSQNLGALMITYPSTHGVFEEAIREIVELIHAHGGQVYMDGANMNAQVGLTNPGFIGADVCHLNLHKTFAIPHGGGGPGVGPIGTAKHLSPFLPTHTLVKTGGEQGISAVSAAPFGSALVLPISYGYIKMMGLEGLKEATKIAILNANYMKAKLEKNYKILYSGKNNRVAHELILDCNEFDKSAGVPVIDIAKRLMDYGFHAPTVAFPVHGTLMVEPTESEPLYEIDRFIEAMDTIREEIREIEEGKAERGNNVVVQAPHTMSVVMAEEWDRPYSRESAAFPSYHVKVDKYWPVVSKIDDGYGDRNLTCSCEPIEHYM
jgi:glycine dehydrogenase